MHGQAIQSVHLSAAEQVFSYSCIFAIMLERQERWVTEQKTGAHQEVPQELHLQKRGEGHEEVVYRIGYLQNHWQSTALVNLRLCLAPDSDVPKNHPNFCKALVHFIPAIGLAKQYQLYTSTTPPPIHTRCLFSLSCLDFRRGDGWIYPDSARLGVFWSWHILYVMR